jgi:hypothetical protein
MAEKNTNSKPFKQHRQTAAIQFSVWSANSAPIPPDVVKQLEESLEREILQLFNQGYRLLTQTTKS